MKAIVADRYGPPDVPRLLELDPPAVARERAAAGIAGRLGLDDPAAQGGELGERRVHARGWTPCSTASPSVKPIAWSSRVSRIRSTVPGSYSR